METFIEHQVSYAERYEPVVLCHRRLRYESPVNHRVRCIGDGLSPVARTLDQVAYDGVRFLPGVTARAAREVIRSVAPRVIHVHYLVDDAFFAPILRDINVPVVVSGYGYDVSRFPGQVFGLGRVYLARGFEPPNLFLAVSEHMKRDLVDLGINAADVRVHYHGVETGRFAYPQREYTGGREVRILSAARLVPKKGHDILLRAIRVLLDRNGLRSKLAVSIVGDGPLREELERLAADLGLRDVVRFKGHIEYTSEGYLVQYRQADLFALPCRTADGVKEGIPGTVVEAMASGLPLVSSVHAGIPEIVRHSVDGLLVAENSVEELADALSTLIAHPNLRAKFGMSAAQRSLEFDVRAKVRELEGVYASLTGEEAENSRRMGGSQPATWKGLRAPGG
jgi:colanic acid/amylovoran biosynthesis glycosyltransferase